MIRSVVLASLVGLAFGFSLSWIGFSSWDAVHEMFIFRSFRLLFTFAAGVTLLVVAWLALARARVHVGMGLRPIHRGTLLGGALFGAGWAVCGACPAIALVQLGEGQLAAIFTLLGILIGNYSYAVVQERWLHWGRVSCTDD